MNPREQKRKCRHFNGISQKACEAGVEYKSVPKLGEGSVLDTMPCFLQMAESEAKKLCDKCSPKTEEEITAEIAEMTKSFANVAKARDAIVKKIGPWVKGKGSGGVIDCPVCGGKETLRYSRAGYNGHIHASCVTKDCVAWME